MQYLGLSDAGVTGDTPRAHWVGGCWRCGPDPRRSLRGRKARSPRGCGLR